MPRDFDADVAVVGAGPAGSSCALHLARAGHRVALIDRRDFPRRKICGEYLNCGAVRELQALPGTSDLEGRALPLYGMELHAHGETAEFAFSKPAWSLPRVVLDDRLRKLAIASGAIETTASVYAVEDDGTGVTLALRGASGDARLRARIVVGADGLHSTIARLTAAARSTNCSRFAIGGHCPGRTRRNWIEMYAAAEGYMALNPVDEERANAMFVVSKERLRRNRGDVAAELARFSHSVSGGRRSFAPEPLRDESLAVGPLAYRVRTAVCGRVILTGDAAGFVDPFTGQGVYLALRAGRLAAQGIDEALRGSRRADRAFHEYERRLRAEVAERERLALFVRVMLMRAALSRRAARALRVRPDDFRPLVDAVTAAADAPLVRLIAAALWALR